MREHQIVINLKPEQYDEVQRLARASGSKSVGVFVRQKLLATLGLNSGSRKISTTEATDAPDLRHLTSELRRLHRELQIFVADSLTNSDYSVPSVESSIPFPTAVKENFLAEGAPLMPESMIGMSDSYMPRTLLGDPAYTIPQAPPDEIAPPPYPVQQPNAEQTDLQPNQAASEDDIQSFAESDELEELAERAFAISPRLGQLEEVAKPFPDPLKDLLEEALLGGVDEEAEELPDEPVAEEEEVAESNEDEPQTEVAEEEVYEEELEPETATETDEEEQTPPDPPQIPPPLSGGPPPRKRST